MDIKPLHILLADDDDDDCELFQEALAGIPIHTQLTIFTNGERLMKWLREHPFNIPDLLFLDLNMPCKNGQDCLKEIRQVPYLKSLPIIILSLTVNPTLVDELYTNGALYYVQKPDSVKGLAPIIEQALNMLNEKNWVQRSPQDFVMHLSN